ncbi:ATPase, T2SS/T4P/T4SS family [Sporosarcina sp. FA9]|uniref:ATPase, T2SS/T4P/T4SS family n=1 Tax=Sporosarcina sp. FA9 TaxID=3413030 RepID=UPI003F655251
MFSTVHSKDPAGSFHRMLDFGVSPEELRQTIVCIAAQRLVRNSKGKMGAVFEIITGSLLDKMADAIIRGERVVFPYDLQIETLVQKYSQPPHEVNG